MRRSNLNRVIVASYLLAVPFSSSAATLEEAFAQVRTCQFRGFFYLPPENKDSGHAYFSERSLKPYMEKDGLYYFKVNDNLWGLPVVELIVPGTWDMHAVVFDVPLKDARKVMTKRFGTLFKKSKASLAGGAPELGQAKDSPSQSALWCNEREAGL